MWVYYIREGELWHNHYLVARRLYSGADDGDGVVEPGEGMNDPSKVAERSVGPVPPGRYILGPAHAHPLTGPVTMRLIPDKDTDTLGRSGFLVHGGAAVGGSSKGCIVAPPTVRAMLATSDDRVLMVVKEAPT
jgi:hypothetical protein